MPSNFDIDFRQIVPRCGSQHEAFEELCCQLAHRTVPKDMPYVRLHGAGGDGGVECFADRPDGNREGWQAKYVLTLVLEFVRVVLSDGYRGYGLARLRIVYILFVGDAFGLQQLLELGGVVLAGEVLDDVRLPECDLKKQTLTFSRTP